MNNIIKIFLSFGLVICSTGAFAQSDATTNSIDEKLNACLDSSQNSSTVGMIDCSLRAKDAWDKELNKYYNLLMATLSTDERNKLKASQRKWLLFRDSENTFSTTMYRNMQGTM